MAIFNSPKIKKIFIVIIVVAAILRLWSLSSADMVNDEVYYSIRSIGYLDYVGMSEQSTPIDWFDPLPKWTFLSFHDHPPLVFLIQHIFFELFGTSIFIARLPFVLAGLISIFLIFLITKKLLGEKVALVSAGLMAIISPTVWMSRTALMESIAIMFILLAWYLFLQALKNNKYWYWWGVAVGLSFLAKYTAFPILAVFLIYLIVYKRQIFKNYRFYLGLILILIVFSPVIIYNILLFQNIGHFDLQFAALLNQAAPEWQTLSVKVSGTFLDKFLAIGPSLLNTFSPASLTLFLLAIIFAVFWWLKEKKSANFFLFLFLAFYFALFVVIKPLPRFIIYIAPCLIILIAQLIVRGWQNNQGIKRNILTVGLVLFLFYELIFSINTNLTTISFGWPNLTFSMVRPYSVDFGVNKLDKYLNQELKGIASATIPQTNNKYLDQYIVNRANQQSLKKQSAYILMVYDPRLYEVSTLWLFEKRFIYDAIPSTYTDDFIKIINERGTEYFKNYNIYYITGTPYTLWRRTYSPKTEALEMEEKFLSQGLEPEVIYNYSGLPVFKIYKFSL